MEHQNPYQSPQSDVSATEFPGGDGIVIDGLAGDIGEQEPAISTANTLLPRYLAAVLDNFLAMILAVVAAKVRMRSICP
jgi:hypothetical protein